MKICVLGLGYIGLPTACLFANANHKVIGVDINQATIEKLNHNELPFEENGLTNLFENAHPNMRFKTQVEEADVFIIAVPTPLNKELKMAELKHVRSAAEMIFPQLRIDNLVILESTVPPGTCDKLLSPLLEKSGLKVGDFRLAHCPERVIPGNTLYEMIHNDRIIGGIDKKSTALAKSLYSCFVKGNFYLTNTIIAEFVKLMENTFRDINMPNHILQIVKRQVDGIKDPVILKSRVVSCII